MKKQSIILAAVTLITLNFELGTLTIFAQAPQFQWAKQMGTVNEDRGYSIAVDVLGNVYTTGYFQGTADFDPGSGTFNLTSAGSADIFISKLDASGNFLWAVKMGGGGADEGYSVAADASGNVYITGKFANDIFISKLDVSGNFLWTKNMGAAGIDAGRSIALDASGNVYITGYFEGTVDFDPNAGIFNLISAGLEDIFISKLDASGNFIWAVKMGSGGNEYGYSLALDASGNVHTTGYFAGITDFDPGSGTFNLNPVNACIFISKLDASGNFIWAKNFGGTSGYGNSIAVDASGNVYTTGWFLSMGIADFDPGPGIFDLPFVGGFDIFISKLDASGNFVWAGSIGKTGDDRGQSIALDASGNVYTTGWFLGSMDFDIGAGTFNLNSGGQWGIFISKLDPSGNFLWAGRIGVGSNNFGYSIATDVSCNVYATGKFGIADFDPGAGNFVMTTVGNYDVYVLKLGCGSPLPISLLSFTAQWLTNEQEKALLTWITATEINNDYFTLERSADGINFSPVAVIDGAGNSSSILNYQYTDNTLPEPTKADVFYYRLKQTDYDGAFTYSDIEVLTRGSITVIDPAPNPINDELNFTLLSAADGEINITITNMLGQLVKKELRATHKGIQQIKIPLSLASGMYMLFVETSDGVERIQKQFVIK